MTSGRERQHAHSGDVFATGRTLGCVGAYDLSKPGDLARLMKVLADWNVLDKAAGESGTVKIYLRRVEK